MNEQFENIEQLRQQYGELGNPVMSIDTKKDVGSSLGG